MAPSVLFWCCFRLAARRVRRAPRRAIDRRLLAALMGLLAAVAPAAAQPAAAVWESLGTFPLRNGARAFSVAFLPAEGAAAADPTRDDLFLFGEYGIFRYAPGGDNGEWGSWRLLCQSFDCAKGKSVVTRDGAIVSVQIFSIVRSTDRGRTWEQDLASGFGGDDVFESTLPGLEGVLFGAGPEAFRSTARGARDTWQTLGSTGGNPGEVITEIPPSPRLPRGRLVTGVWNGITYSDDGGVSWRRSSAYGPAAYIGFSLSFAPVAGHPYGGTLYAGLGDTQYYPGSFGTVARSDDGAATWTITHRFDPAAWGMNKVTEVEVLATADGALWAGLSDGSTGQGHDGFRLGAVVRSTDGGRTWAAGGTGYGGGGVFRLSLSRTGALYAASWQGVWRTTGPAVVVAGEAKPETTEGPGVSVRPNPTAGRAEVVLSLAETQDVRAVVLDAQGREVAVVHAGPLAAGERAVPVDTSAWPVGVYVVRVVAGERTASARLVVAR